MQGILVRDLRGRPIGYLDGDRLRDDSAKPVADRAVGEERRMRTLAQRAASLMSDRPILMDLAPTDVATPATQAAFGIPQTELVADKVSEVRYVTQVSGIWYQENASEAIEPTIPSISADASAPELSPGFSSTQYNTAGYALATRIPRGLKSNADFDIEEKALRRIVEALRLAREQRIVTLLTTSGNWATANRVAATAKWNGGANPAPLGDLFAALVTSYLPVTTMILSENVAQYFYSQPSGDTSPSVRDYVQSGGELPDRLYARAKKLVSGSPAYIWAPTLPANVALVRTGVDPKSIPTSLTFRWLGEGPDGEVFEGMLVRKFFDGKTDTHWLVCAHHDAEVFVSNQVGAIITGALQ